MQIPRLRISLIIGVIIVGFIVLVAGQNVYHKYTMEQPLLDELNTFKEVQTCEISRENKKITVELGEVESLKTTYGQIGSEVAKHTRLNDYDIVITDERNQKLEEAYYQSQFALYQAAIKGDFVDMHQYIEEVVENRKIDRYSVSLDNERIYVQFFDNEHYLYEVIDRQANIPSNWSGNNRSG